ncbi:hypothetical protein VTL71DRAFT_1266 [Oculimacula yallundae]|uniref:Peroxin domain-containing protein n=1 Tax=Oculimacula yallundae TaxID=86028 RepID=A0ABR4CBD7_9HELO
MKAITHITAEIEKFFAAESLIPDRLIGLLNSRLATRLTYIYRYLVSSIQIAYALRYTLLPVLPIIFIFILIIIFTPPPNPLITLRLPGPKISIQQINTPPTGSELTYYKSIQYPWPISGWIEKKPMRYMLNGCVVVWEGSERWEASALWRKQGSVRKRRSSARKRQLEKPSWVVRMWMEVRTNWATVGRGARVGIGIGIGVVLLGMAIL